MALPPTSIEANIMNIMTTQDSNNIHDILYDKTNSTKQANIYNTHVFKMSDLKNDPLQSI